MLRMENVRKNYKDFALDCTLEVPEGCVTGLIGRNGAGKSTVFKAALGLIRTEGSVTIMGKNVAEIGKKEKEEIGVVFPESGFSGYLTVNDVTGIMGNMYSRFDKADFLDKCEQFHIPARKQIKEFSTGMKRKLQMLIALSHDARLLILDEPTTGLDVVARDSLFQMLREYMEDGERSILISSHISGDLERFCDDIYMIHEGKIIFHEEADVLSDQYGILKVSREQYEDLDRRHILCRMEEPFGYSCLTDEKQFYMENYPKIVVEKGNIDDLIMIKTRGEKI